MWCRNERNRLRNTLVILHFRTMRDATLYNVQCTNNVYSSISQSKLSNVMPAKYYAAVSRVSETMHTLRKTKNYSFCYSIFKWFLTIEVTVEKCKVRVLWYQIVLTIVTINVCTRNSSAHKLWKRSLRNVPKSGCSEKPFLKKLFVCWKELCHLSIN